MTLYIRNCRGCASNKHLFFPISQSYNAQPPEDLDALLPAVRNIDLSP
jgi:hypothetical protein